MSKGKKDKIDTSGGSGFLSNNPFGTLDALSSGLPKANPKPTLPIVPTKETKKGRIDVKRVVGGRSGKTVTLVEGEAFLNETEEVLKQLANHLKKTCGVGGTVKDKTIEIQGDKRELVSEMLKKEGYRVVLAGG